MLPAGSSLLAKLCAALAADALKLAGLHDQGLAVVLPCATGMTLTLVLLAAATGKGGAPPSSQPPQQPQPQPPQSPPQPPQQPPALPPPAPTTAAAEAAAPQLAAAAGVRSGGGAAAQKPGAIAAIESVVPPKPTDLPHTPTAPETFNSHQQQQQAQTSQQQQQQQKRYVIWSRIDQKTCLKSISAANLTPVVVELLRQGDELVTDVGAIKAALERLGSHNVAAVVTTTSCFAPR